MGSGPARDPYRTGTHKRQPENYRRPRATDPRARSTPGRRQHPKLLAPGAQSPALRFAPIAAGGFANSDARGGDVPAGRGVNFSWAVENFLLDPNRFGTHMRASKRVAKSLDSRGAL